MNVKGNTLIKMCWS